MGEFEGDYGVLKHDIGRLRYRVRKAIALWVSEHTRN